MAGILVVVAVVVTIVLTVLYKRRKRYWYIFTPHSKVKPRTHTQTVELENPLYSGKLMTFLCLKLLLFSGCYRILIHKIMSIIVYHMLMKFLQFQPEFHLEICIIKLPMFQLQVFLRAYH